MLLRLRINFFGSKASKANDVDSRNDLGGWGLEEELEGSGSFFRKEGTMFLYDSIAAILSFERFPNNDLVKTENLEFQLSC